MEKYSRSRTLGGGSFGSVWKAIRKSDRVIVAMKVIDIKKWNNLNYGNSPSIEAEILKNLKHPQIVEILEYFKTETEEVLVLEYAPHGDLLELINLTEDGFSEKIAKSFFRQLLEGLSYIHSHFYIHGDLKLENILLFGELNHSYTKTILKIADFGFAIPWRKDQTMKYRCGSLDYASPEVIFNRDIIGPEVDVWSLGVILFAIVCGNLPFQFDGINVSDVYISYAQKGLSTEKDVTQDFLNLVQKMIEIKSKRRITIEEIFNHPWISESDSLEESIKLNLEKITQISYSITSPKYSPSSKNSPILELSPRRTPNLCPTSSPLSRPSASSYFTNLSHRSSHSSDTKNAQLIPIHKLSNLLNLSVAPEIRSPPETKPSPLLHSLSNKTSSNLEPDKITQVPTDSLRPKSVPKDRSLD